MSGLAQIMTAASDRASVTEFYVLAGHGYLTFYSSFYALIHSIADDIQLLEPCRAVTYRDGRLAWCYGPVAASTSNMKSGSKSPRHRLKESLEAPCDD